MAALFPKLPEEYEPEAPALRLPCQEARALKGHEGAVLAVRFNDQGTYCLSCGKVGRQTTENMH